MDVELEHPPRRIGTSEDQARDEAMLAREPHLKTDPATGQLVPEDVQGESGSNVPADQIPSAVEPPAPESQVGRSVAA